MCYGIIYMVRNKKNNKVYIGQTTKTFDERYGGSIENTHNKYLRRSIEKDKIENFVINKCVCECESKEELDKMEQFYIDFFNSMDSKYGYNMRGGGSNGKLSEETKEKISEAQKGEKSCWYGKHHSEETKQKMSEAKKGKHYSEEARQKMSEAKKRKYCGENHPMYGKNPFVKKTEEEMKEIKEKISKGNKGKRHTEEAKEKISKAKKGRNNPNARAIVQLDKQGNFIRKWDYIKQAKKELNISNISNCCRGEYKSAGGYKWMYEDDYLDLLQYAF